MGLCVWYHQSILQRNGPFGLDLGFPEHATLQWLDPLSLSSVGLDSSWAPKMVPKTSPLRLWQITFYWICIMPLHVAAFIFDMSIQVEYFLGALGLGLILTGRSNIITSYATKCYSTRQLNAAIFHDCGLIINHWAVFTQFGFNSVLYDHHM